MAPHAWVISLTSVCKTSLNRVLHFISYRIFQGKLADESFAQAYAYWEKSIWNNNNNVVDATQLMLLWS